MLVLSDWRTATASGIYSLWFASGIAFLTVLKVLPPPWKAWMKESLLALLGAVRSVLIFEKFHKSSQQLLSVCVCVCVCTHTSVCWILFSPIPWRPEEDISVLLCLSLPYCLEAVSLWIWRLASSQQASLTLLSVPDSTDVIGARGYIRLFMWIIGIWTQVLMLVQQALLLGR